MGSRLPTIAQASSRASWKLLAISDLFQVAQLARFFNRKVGDLTTATTIRLPTAGTLAKYGLTADDWLALCQRQGNCCPVCGEEFGDRPLAIDHEHVRGFKARKVRSRKGRRFKVRVMAPAERRRHVRGVLHSYCNRFVRRWLTLPRAVAIVAYLQEHERRRS